MWRTVVAAYFEDRSTVRGPTTVITDVDIDLYFILLIPFGVVLLLDASC